MIKTIDLLICPHDQAFALLSALVNDQRFIPKKVLLLHEKNSEEAPQQTIALPTVLNIKHIKVKSFKNGFHLKKIDSFIAKQLKKHHHKTVVLAHTTINSRLILGAMPAFIHANQVLGFYEKASCTMTFYYPDGRFYTTKLLDHHAKKAVSKKAVSKKVSKKVVSEKVKSKATKEDESKSVQEDVFSKALHSHGFTFITNTTDIHPRTKNVAHYFIHNFADHYADIHKVLQEIASAGASSEHPYEITIPNEPAVEKCLEQLSQLKLLHFTPLTDLKFSAYFENKEAQHLLTTGAWLEEYVFCTLQKLKNKGMFTFEFLARNVRIQNLQGNVKAEFDLMFIIHGVIHVIECKSGHTLTGQASPKHAIEKIAGFFESLDLPVKIALVAHKPLSDDIVNFAKEHHVLALSGKQLCNLHTLLPAWMTSKKV